MPNITKSNRAKAFLSTGTAIWLATLLMSPPAYAESAVTPLSNHETKVAEAERPGIGHDSVWACAGEKGPHYRN